MTFTHEIGEVVYLIQHVVEFAQIECWIMDQCFVFTLDYEKIMNINYKCIFHFVL